MTFNLEPLKSIVVDDTSKAIPSGVKLSLSAIGGQGWNVLAGDVPLPVAVIRTQALQHNSRWMQKFVAERGALIAPHVKTTMCPQIMAQQLADGAWALTVATIQQLQVCAAFGATRIILANQAVGGAELDTIAGIIKAGKIDFMMLIDSEAGIAAATAAMKRHQVTVPLQVLVERGYEGGRTGCRTNQEALELARKISAAPELSLVGVEAFEGLIKAPAEHKEQVVAAFMDDIAALYQACKDEGLFGCENPLVTAGGSSYYDIVLERLAGCGARVVTRSGCYVTHDSALYHAQHQRLAAHTGETDGLRRALEVWAYVQSIPEKGLALVSAGRRDCGTDAGFPVPHLVSKQGGKPQDLPEACEIIDMNDQHGFMRFPEELELSVGDMIGMGISHPCTTFDKWDILSLVDEDYNIIDALKTYF